MPFLGVTNINIGVLNIVTLKTKKLIVLLCTNIRILGNTEIIVFLKTIVNAIGYASSGNPKREMRQDGMDYYIKLPIASGPQFHNQEASIFTLITN